VPDKLDPDQSKGKGRYRNRAILKSLINEDILDYYDYNQIEAGPAAIEKGANTTKNKEHISINETSIRGLEGRGGANDTQLLR
jgi:hypothetical protein